MEWEVRHRYSTFGHLLNQMETIVVTGANGFIGRHCLPLLVSCGYTVHAISTTKSGRDDAGINWHKLNLLREPTNELLNEIRPSHLLHLAWCTEHGLYWNSPQNPTWLQASQALLSNFYACGGTRFVNVGTCAEYTWPGECEEGKTEERPATLYGQSKKAFADQVLTYNVTASKMSTASGRIFLLYGPGESAKRLVPSVITTLLEGQSPRCTDGMQVRDFMYVEDVAMALVALLNSSVNGIVNIASGQPITLKSLITLISSVLNSQTEVYFNAVPRSPGDPDVLTASTRRLNDEVGFWPKYTLEAGIKKTIDFIHNSTE